MVKNAVTVIFILILLASCYISVPHDSRYDDLNPFGKGSLSILVLDKSGEPQESALVKLNDTLLFYTNKSGEFNLGTFSKGALAVSVEKDGYRDFYLDTAVKTGSLLDLNITLNYIPVVEDFFAYSTVRRIESLTDTLDYGVNYAGIIREADGIGDIDSCVLLLDTLRFKMALSGSGGTVRCTLNFSEDNPYFQIYDLQGKNGSIEVYDKSGETVTSRDANLVRFVETIPAITSPTDGGVMVLPDSVEWTSESVLFDSYFKVMIYGLGGLVLTVDSIDASKRSVYLGTLLNEGSYSLYLQLYDAFGNYSENSAKFSVF